LLTSTQKPLISKLPYHLTPLAKIKTQKTRFLPARLTQKNYFEILFQYILRPAGGMNEIFNRGRAIAQKNIHRQALNEYLSADLLYQSRAKQKNHLGHQSKWLSCKGLACYGGFNRLQLL
jgi:hypothetical protein